MLLLVAGLAHHFVRGELAVHTNAKGHSGSRDFHYWQQLGLLLVPAAWLLLNMLPNAMVLAYAYLPHAHRMQSAAVKFGMVS